MVAREKEMAGNAFLKESLSCPFGVVFSSVKITFFKANIIKKKYMICQTSESEGIRSKSQRSEGLPRRPQIPSTPNELIVTCPRLSAKLRGTVLNHDLQATQSVQNPIDIFGVPAYLDGR